ncbi:MAG: CARDB domain-containing protein [Planctomycetota bacterium]
MALAVALSACGNSSGGGSGGADDPGGSGSGSLPDLVCTGISFQPAAVVAGTSISVSDTVKNQGGSSATDLQVAIYLSSDPTVEAGDRLLGFRTIGVLASGTSSSGGGTLTVPASTTAGTYYVGAWADDAASIVELSETNNARVASGTLTVSSAVLPNLVVSALTFTPAAAVAGETIDVSDTVRNIGNAPSGAFQVGIYLSSDALVTPFDRLLGLRAVTALAAGASASSGGSLTLPLNLTAGSYFVGAIVDPGGAANELDELDNARVAGAQLDVSAPPRPDLSIGALSFAPPVADTGTEITVQDVVHNTGDADAAAFDVVYFLSTDATITTADERLGTRSVAALTVDERDVSALALVVPIELAGGTYYVGALADADGDVAELDESNNAQHAAATIRLTVPPRPDLIVNAVSFQPSIVDVDRGERVVVTDLVKNIGTNSAAPFRVGIYLSANNVISTSDVLLGTRAIGALAIGDGSGGNLELALPAGLSPGTYFVGVVADDEAALLELRESNNVLLASATLDVISTPAPRPDLRVHMLAFGPPQVLPGGAVQVQSVVRNEGDLSAGAFQVGIYLSDDAAVSVDDRKIGERTIFQLGIQFGSASSAPIPVPATIPPGDYFVGAIADIHGAVEENDEDNNVLVALGRLRVYVPPPPAPELWVESVSSSLATDGASIVVSCTVRNRGDLAAGPFRVAYSLSTDDSAGASDIPLGTQAITGLGASQSFQGTATFEVPDGVRGGAYRVCAVADDEGTVAENAEDDNAQCSDETVQLP